MVITWPTVTGFGWVDTEPMHSKHKCRRNVTLASLSDWYIKDLKHCLLQAKLNTFGTKTDLIARLHAYLSSDYEQVLYPAVIPVEEAKQASCTKYLQIQD